MPSHAQQGVGDVHLSGISLVGGVTGSIPGTGLDASLRIVNGSRGIGVIGSAGLIPNLVLDVEFGRNLDFG